MIIDENDNDVYEPNECYFSMMDTSDGDTVAITSIKYWNENKCLDDCFGEHSLPKNIIKKFRDAKIDSIMEAMWICDSMVKEKVKQFMLDLGFVWLQEMCDSFSD